LCPPPLTAISRPEARAKRTASATSLAVEQRATIAGLRSMAPFQSAREESYSGSPGLSARPLNLVAKSRAPASNKVVICALLDSCCEAKWIESDASHPWMPERVTRHRG